MKLKWSGWPCQSAISIFYCSTAHVQLLAATCSSDLFMILQSSIQEEFRNVYFNQYSCRLFEYENYVYITWTQRPTCRKKRFESLKVSQIPALTLQLQGFCPLGSCEMVSLRLSGGAKYRLPFFGGSQITWICDTFLIAALSGSSIWHKNHWVNRPLMQTLWRI